MKVSAKSWSDNILGFNRTLDFNGKLPPGISILNPFRDNPKVFPIAEKFYSKFYNDKLPRTLILGINPGRLGAGATGIPFTDTKRLTDKCGIDMNDLHTHEPSSVYVYNVIDAYGGTEKFYNEFYISSICPLGFVAAKDGREVNYNYYDNKHLENAVKNFAVESLKTQIAFGIRTDRCFCFGTGKNFKFIKDLNDEHHFFRQVIPLEHPRYIMQYKSKQMESYITKYLQAFLE